MKLDSIESSLFCELNTFPEFLLVELNVIQSHFVRNLMLSSLGEMNVSDLNGRWSLGMKSFGSFSQT